MGFLGVSGVSKVFQGVLKELQGSLRSFRGSPRSFRMAKLLHDGNFDKGLLTD